MRTLNSLAAALAVGKTTSRQLVEDCLARIADPGGEGARTFIKLDAAAARASADAMDTLRRAGRAPGPFAGIPFSIKDLADIAGQPTPAGSKVLASAPPAAANAPVVQRIMDAGFVVMGRTNMTEFAFSGLGINPHYGTPKSPWDRATGRIPGGSSSGAAVSVADAMAYGALGTDTGGSCRIPAAMCGIVGYKPTARRVPITGVLPLSTSLDSIGPLANSVACIAALDAIFAGETPPDLAPTPLAGLRLAAPENFFLDGADREVLTAYEAALSRLSAAGAHVIRIRLAAIDAVLLANARGGFAIAESWAQHRDLIATSADGYDPQVLKRILPGRDMQAADYIALLAARAETCARATAETRDYDALVMPTCPLLPPPIAALEADNTAYTRTNMMQLRNCAIGNFLDRCAISLPCTPPGSPPVGLMLMGETMGDAKLLRVAAAVEGALA
ncbi:MAG: amidase [Acetobacteraceae bacterium]|nr:amidase [Acetobacteraceae bacterium]